MLETTSYIHLSRAYLCVDCNHVQNSSVQCIGCNSRAVMSLSQVLDRTATGPSHTCVDQPQLPCAVPECDEWRTRWSNELKAEQRGDTLLL